MRSPMIWVIDPNETGFDNTFDNKRRRAARDRIIEATRGHQRIYWATDSANDGYVFTFPAHPRPGKNRAFVLDEAGRLVDSSELGDPPAPPVVEDDLEAYARAIVWVLDHAGLTEAHLADHTTQVTFARLLGRRLMTTGNIPRRRSTHAATIAGLVAAQPTLDPDNTVQLLAGCGFDTDEQQVAYRALTAIDECEQALLALAGQDDQVARFDMFSDAWFDTYGPDNIKRLWSARPRGPMPFGTLNGPQRHLLELLVANGCNRERASTAIHAAGPHATVADLPHDLIVRYAGSVDPILDRFEFAALSATPNPPAAPFGAQLPVLVTWQFVPSDGNLDARVIDLANPDTTGLPEPIAARLDAAAKLVTVAGATHEHLELSLYLFPSHYRWLEMSVERMISNAGGAKHRSPSPGSIAAALLLAGIPNYPRAADLLRIAGPARATVDAAWDECATDPKAFDKPWNTLRRTYKTLGGPAYLGTYISQLAYHLPRNSKHLPAGVGHPFLPNRPGGPRPSR